MYRRKRSTWLKHLDFMFFDIIALNLAYVIGFYIRFPGQGNPYGDTVYRQIIIIHMVCVLLTGFMLNSYNKILKRSFMREIRAVFADVVVSFVFLLLFLFLLHMTEIYSRIVLGATTASFGLLSVLFRTTWKKLILWNIHRQAVHRTGNVRSLLIVSDRAGAPTIIEDVKKDIGEPLEIAGLILTDRTEEDRRINGVPVVANLENGADYMLNRWIDEVMVYLPEYDTSAMPFIRSCRKMGITVHTVLGMEDDMVGKRFIESMCGHTVMTTSVNYLTAKQALIKRLFDIAGGLVGTFVAGILILIFGPMIWFKSRGPILFVQERVGQNGKKFKLYKLRTMVPDAEAKKKELEEQNLVHDGLMFKLDFDPRVIGNEILPDGTHKTGLGEFIRKWSIDEFPQFFNILKGDMSLIGTRPPTVDEWERYDYHHRARLAMRPGLTGMWQVSGRSEITDFEQVVKLDTYYITHFSLRLDAKILFQTIGVWFSRKGAM